MTNIFEKIKSYLEFQNEISDGLLFKENITINNNITSEINEPILEYSKSTKEIEIKVNKNQISNWQDSSSLDELYSKIHNCHECKLSETRTNFVFGIGNPNADIMIIGEAPGQEEDLKGEPFVGRAGQLLTNIIQAINLSREEVFIANIIKCRPPKNRRPEKEEVEKCEPYLQKQIELIKPKFILALGLTAVDTLLKSKHKMGEIRGQIFNYHNTKMIVTYHPAALLRNPNWKKDTWQDVKMLRKLYDDYLANKEEN